MFTEGVDYKVIVPEKKYRMLRNYKHDWLGKPPIVKNHVRKIDSIQFRTNGITLLKGYVWNGDNVVPDRKRTMRASAVHDAWCKSMKKGVYRNRRKNWNRGILEYAKICLDDEVEELEVILRRAAMFKYGIFKYGISWRLLRWLLRRFKGPSAIIGRYLGGFKFWFQSKL